MVDGGGMVGGSKVVDGSGPVGGRTVDEFDRVSASALSIRGLFARDLLVSFARFLRFALREPGGNCSSMAVRA